MYFDTHPIIKDFDRFVDYIRTAGNLELTKGTANLRAMDLLALNGQMGQPVQIAKNKPTHKDFILLTAFYYIGLSAELWIMRRDAKGIFYAMAQPNRMAIYDQMTDDERYGFLLQAYWCYFDMYTAFEDRDFHIYKFLFEIILAFEVGKPSVLRKKFSLPIVKHIMVVLSAFGMFKFSIDNKEKAYAGHIFVETITLTEIGKKIISVLNQLSMDWRGLDPKMTEERWAKMYEEPSDEDDMPEFSDFFGQFRSSYPEWDVKTRLFPITSPVVIGVYTFKISLEDCYRVVALHSSATLEDLHHAIQNTFEFDNDHLYAFYMNGHKSTTPGNLFATPEIDGQIDEYPSDVFALGELGLYVNQYILYVFDFGVNWEFNIEISDFAESNNDKPFIGHKLLKSVGEAPPQYESWDEEDGY